jgi:hypothetical protein
MNNSIGPQRHWTPSQERPMPVDSAEKVAEKIAEAIKTEEAENIV